MNEIKEDIRVIREDIASMKVDLHHHIKRSDKHEKWLMTLIILLSASAGAGLIKVAPVVSSLLP